MNKEQVPVDQTDEPTDEYGLPDMNFYELKEHFGSVEAMLRAYLERFVYRDAL